MRQDDTERRAHRQALIRELNSAPRRAWPLGEAAPGLADFERRDYFCALGAAITRAAETRIQSSGSGSNGKYPLMVGLSRKSTASNGRSGESVGLS